MFKSCFSNSKDDYYYNYDDNSRRHFASDEDRGRWVAEPGIDRKASAFIARFYASRNASTSSLEGIVSRLRVEVESSSWLDNWYVGRLLEVPNMRLVKESFILGDFDVVRLRYLEEKFVLLSRAEEGLIGKLLEEGKDRFAGMFGSIVPWDDSFKVNERYAWVRCRGIPLHLWSRHCFERVGALVGKVVEVDQATMAREVLEYVRLLDRYSVVGRPVGIESVAGSEDVGGRGRLASVGSYSNEEYKRREGKEITVRCKAAQVEPILGAAQQKRSFNSVVNATLGVGEGILDGKILDKQGEVSIAECGKTSSDSSKVVGGVIKCRRVKNAACINGVKEVIENVQEENGRARHEMVGGKSNGSSLQRRNYTWI
ncbi:hypothetical protein ACSQ67_006393 [Phaseolus vulgaris]